MFGLSLATAPALAQNQDEQSWIKLDASTKLFEGVELVIETNQRLSDDLGGLYESQYSAVVGIEIAEGVTLTGGVNRVVALSNGRISNTEWRPRQQISFPIMMLGGGKLAGRVRFEQRFLGNGQDVGHRVRPAISYALPLSEALSLTFAHESYFNFNTTDFGQDAGHERMRNSATLSFPIAERLKAEVGYMNQYRFNGANRDLMEHALTLGFLIRL
ncbi:DUF2490 domain-containing protein [Sphingomonas sp. A2-49]|uniref:DUF2490 domain-containing protein n=1 Tax=Sphingomonas sp. A2-49 TaxID=1391375 RepID=UPI0021D2EC89|nr:DUF2490 domain-containing protein [Sphingomonas sp. A2-49]MCU6453390.1 DUF2490 domain-containing protein [Sphingomonas sp. A2-49]